MIKLLLKIPRFERAGSSPACGTIVKEALTLNLSVLVLMDVNRTAARRRYPDNWSLWLLWHKITIYKKTQSAIFLNKLREPCVAGSNPAPLTNEWVAQLVEQRLKSVLFLCRVLAVVAGVAHNHEVGSSNLSSAPNS